MMDKSNRTIQITISALLATAAILLGYIEFLIPVFPPIAGIKLGLGNIAVLLAMMVMPSAAYSLGIMLTKVILCALLFGGMGSLPYSLTGGIMSFIIMLLFARFTVLSAAGISALGGSVHMIAQVCVAACITSVAEVTTLIPVLMAVGSITGFVNGIIVNMLKHNISRYLKFEKNNR